MAIGVAEITIFIILGTLAAIVYSLRILVLLDRRIEKIEKHIKVISNKIVQEELKIEKTVAKKKR